jgi:hypothetical protein
MTASIASPIIATIAALTTILIAWRQHRREQNAYLVLGLDLEEVKENLLIIHTSLDNKSALRKQIDAVQLIVCRYNEKPENAASELQREWEDQRGQPQHAEPLKDMRDIASVHLEKALPRDAHDKPLPGKGRVWLPLLYYTEENRWVADEILTCDAVIDVSEFNAGEAYSVRLVLVGPTWPMRTVFYSVLYTTIHWTGSKLNRGVRRLFFRPDDKKTKEPNTGRFRRFRNLFVLPSPKKCKRKGVQTTKPDIGLYRVVHKSFVMPKK